MKKGAAADTPTLKSQILSSLEGLNRGLDVDADSDVMTKQESQVRVSTQIPFRITNNHNHKF